MENKDNYTCIRCGATGPGTKIRQRNSYKEDVGILCEDCCHTFMDNCGLYGTFGNPIEETQPQEEEVL